MKKFRTIALICAVCFALNLINFTAVFADSAVDEQAAETEASQMFDITIDGDTRNTDENSEWQGFGFISANNSSRLLLDYKAENPEAYQQILKTLFDPEGAVRMTHIKIELGADINSSSGTEPAVKRSEDEECDVTRGAGFQLAADALKINPDITLELLSWGAPGYIKNTSDYDEKQRLRYEWFKETLDAAYETYGLQFDYIAPNYNEKAVDANWIKYFSKSLKSEQNTPYDYGAIKVVAADEENRFTLAEKMLSDPELMAAVDVIGIHYTSTSDENTLRCKNEFGKELWYSEGISPANVSEYAANADGNGISGVNSLLDVAGRIVNMYPNGGFTMYEFQPAVSAYYSGATYYPKHLITANEPWSGYTELGSGIYMCEHFSLFSKEGWQFVDSGCTGDGTEENHVLSDTTNNCLTLSDPETDDYSVILVNNTDAARIYRFTVKNLDKAQSEVYVWETKGADEGKEYDSSFLKNIMSIQPEEDSNGGYTYQLTVKANSMVTVSTLDVKSSELTSESEYSRLELPYSDDFEYSDYDDDYLASRGYAPRYTTDLGGAFEVVEDEKQGRILRQQISADMKGVEWASSPEPVTTLGDDTWANYTVSADVLLENPEGDYDPSENYVGVGLRYINASARNSRSGYGLSISGDGKWRLFHISQTLAEGELDDFNSKEWHTLSITAAGDGLTAAVDGVQVTAVTLSGSVTFSGRAALFSAYYQNCFDNLNVLPTDLTDYTVRMDNLDSAVKYSGEWLHNTMDSYTCHNRTSSENSGEASFTFSFEGDSLALIGTADDAVISVEIDGTTVAQSETVANSDAKAAFWHRYSLGYGEHDVKVTVLSGTVKLDALEYGSMSEFKDGSGAVLSDNEDDEETISVKHIATKENGVSKLFAVASAAVIASGIVAVVLTLRRKKPKDNT